MTDAGRFTGGPWVVATNSNDRRVIVEGVDGQRIASAFFRGDVPEWVDIAEANAALMAAAPDLYAITKRLLLYAESGTSSQALLNALIADARAALSKATVKPGGAP